jgi:hypothetical protein
MILATVAMLFQISAVSPAMPAQPQQAQVIMAENQPSSVPDLHQGDSTDTAKVSSHSVLIDHENARQMPAERADAKILAENDPVRMLGVDNEAQMLAAVEAPTRTEVMDPLPEGAKSVHRPSKVWKMVTASQRKLQGLIQGR